MRDLTSRLRDIVRQDVTRVPAPTGLRELTYVPDAGRIAEFDSRRAAKLLGGSVVEHAAGACIAIDRTWDGDEWHGRRQIASYRSHFTNDAPLALFDRRAPGGAGWADRIVFFDVETTGLSGGAGTLAFLVGCGWFQADVFHVRQFFLSGPASEPAMLAELARVFDDATLLVTYNGRTFDVPLMETRWAFHRKASPTDDLPHFDMLPPARRLWKGAAIESCSLASLERSILGFHRTADVPGFEIPARYFHFLRTSDTRAIDGILEHNRHDLLSLAALTAHALWLAKEGPMACREPGEQLGLGRLYERAGQAARAAEAYDLAARTGDHGVRRLALTYLALQLRRDRRFADAAAAWQQVLHLAADDVLSPLERRAAEALAIHHEHRAHDLAVARHYAEILRAQSRGRAMSDATHRITRIDRKLQTPEKKKGGQSAAPLLESDF